MNDAKHFDSLNPIFATETPTKGRKIYTTVCNKDNVAFNTIITLTEVGNLVIELEVKVIGEHGISENDLLDMVHEIVKKEDNSLTFVL
jgi:hypothetical protein